MAILRTCYYYLVLTDNTVVGTDITVGHTDHNANKVEVPFTTYSKVVDALKEGIYVIQWLDNTIDIRLDIDKYRLTALAKVDDIEFRVFNSLPFRTHLSGMSINPQDIPLIHMAGTSGTTLTLIQDTPIKLSGTACMLIIRDWVMYCSSFNVAAYTVRNSLTLANNRQDIDTLIRSFEQEWVVE